MSRHLWPTVFILLLAALLRMHALGADSLWMDEAVSVFGARPPARETLSIVLTDGVHPPLYYFLQKVSFPLGGSEFALRWPAAVIGVLAVSALARVGREWVSRNAGVLAALLVALSPFAVWYSREARMYSLVMLLTVGVMGAFTAILSSVEQPRSGRTATPAPDAGAGGSYALLTVLSSVLYFTHYFGLFAPLIQFVYLLLTFRRNFRILKPWLAAQLVAAVPIALWIVALYGRGAYFGIGWIHSTRWVDPLLTLQNFTVGYGPEWLHRAAAGLFGLVGAVGLLAMVRSNPERSHLPRMQVPWSLLALWLLLPPLMTLALSSRRPVYVDRFLIGSLPALMLAVAAGMLSILRKRKAIGLALSGLLLAAPLMANLALFDDQTDAREDWQGAAKFIQSEERPGDVLLLRSVIYRLPFGHYYLGGAQPQSVDTGWRLTSPSEWREPGQRLWLVYRGRLEDAHRFGESLAADFDRDEAEASVRGWLRTIEPYLVERHDFPGVAVSLYEFSHLTAPHENEQGFRKEQ